MVIFQEPKPTPFDLRWRMFGIHVRVHPFFWLFSAFFGWHWMAFGFPYLLTWIACMFVSILVHELGHVVMGIWCGSWGHIVLYSFGGLAVGSNNVDKSWQRVAVVLAGPAAGLMLYGICYGVKYGGVLNAIDPAQQWPWLWRAFDDRMLLFMNLVWNVMNLLPIFPLDGGQAVVEIAKGVSPVNGERMGLGMSFVTAAGVALYSYYAPRNPNLWYPRIDPMFAMLFFGFLAFQNFMMLRAIQARRSRPWEDEGY